MLKKLENFPNRGRKRGGGHGECWTLEKHERKRRRDRSKRVKKGIETRKGIKREGRGWEAKERDTKGRWKRTRGLMQENRMGGKVQPVDRKLKKGRKMGGEGKKCGGKGSEMRGKRSERKRNTGGEGKGKDGG